MFCIDNWNLNNLVEHNFTKVALLKAYLSIQRFDIFRISETYLNSSITENDNSLPLPPCDLIRFDHLLNNKRGALQFITKIFYL